MALSAEEAEIGKRMLLARREHGANQALTARRMLLSRDQLKRIERSEVAVRLVPALRFCEFANRNPLWLAFGEDENRFGFFWPKERDDGSWILLAIGDDWASDAAIAESVAQDLTLLEAIHKYNERFSRATRFFATSDTQPGWSIGVPPRPIGALFLDNVNEQLTTPAKFGIVGSMNLQKESFWPVLREKIRNLVQRRGAKSALARDIGVTRQAVNALLSKKYIPSGEQVLKLSKWLEIAEAQQKQSAGSASTRPAPKTRERKSKHEKPNSDRQKK